MSYTAAQEKIVLKVLLYKQHQFYEILECERSASDGEIKKSYRKLAVKLHPDKNPHPRALEAFKLLNKAWSVLGDESKKSIFDQTGADPDARASAATSSGHSPFQGQAFQRGFADDDILNFFFGGGGRPGTTFTFGGNNGFSFQTFGNGNGFNGGFDPFTGGFTQRPRTTTRPARGREPTTWETVKQLAPIVVILVATLVLTFFSLDGVADHLFSRTGRFSVQRTTPRHRIPFYVADTFADDKSAHQLRTFDKKVEQAYVLDRRTRCNRERAVRNQMMDEAQGWLFTDTEKMEAARRMPMPYCQELLDLGLL